MKKNLFSLRVDLILFTQFLLVTIMGLIEHHSLPSFHGFMGLALMAGAGVHLVLHWRWVDTALHQYRQMSTAAQTNAKLVLILFSAYLACGVTGLVVSKTPSHLLKHLHHLFALIVIVTQTIHLARHWKWIWTTSTRALVNVNSSTHKPSSA